MKLIRKIISDFKTEGIPRMKQKTFRQNWRCIVTHWSDRDEIGGCWVWYKVWQ